MSLGILVSWDMTSMTSSDFTGSVGLAVYPGDAADAEALFKHADRDMYLRKAAARIDVDTPL